MADSSVPITAGSGTNIDTRTETTNSNHRQVIVVGDPAVNNGVAPVDATYGLRVDDGAPSVQHFVAAATTNALNVKASPGVLRGFSIYNNRSSPVYLKFHNTAGAPTAGAGVVVSFGVQGGTQRDVWLPGRGLAFATGIGRTLVTGIADADATATAANDAVVEIFYE